MIDINLQISNDQSVSKAIIVSNVKISNIRDICRIKQRKKKRKKREREREGKEFNQIGVHLHTGKNLITNAPYHAPNKFFSVTKQKDSVYGTFGARDQSGEA